MRRNKQAEHKKPGVKKNRKEKKVIVYPCRRLEKENGTGKRKFDSDYCSLGEQGAIETWSKERD